MNLLDRLLVRLFRRARSLEDRERYEGYRAQHQIHPSFKFNGPGIILSNEGRITLGADSYLGMHSMLLSKPGTEVVIGEKTSISHFFVVYTKNVDADQDMSLPTETWEQHKGSVRIGSYCWIGFRVLVLEGVTIGDNVVIGAHSVVTKDLPSNGIYGGVPARLLRMKKGHT
jgi:maltose O-acetyltransferase